MSTLPPELRSTRILLLTLWWAALLLLGGGLALGVALIGSMPSAATGEGSGPFVLALFGLLALVVIAGLWVLRGVVRRRVQALDGVARLLEAGPSAELELAYRPLSLIGLLALRPLHSQGQGPAWWLLPLTTRDRLPRPGHHSATLYWDSASVERLAALRQKKLLWGRVLTAEEVRQHGRNMFWLLASVGLLAVALLFPALVLLHHTMAPLEQDWRRVEAWQPLRGTILEATVTANEDDHGPAVESRLRVMADTPLGPRSITLSGPVETDSRRVDQWLVEHPIGSGIEIMTDKARVFAMTLEEHETLARLAREAQSARRLVSLGMAGLIIVALSLAAWARREAGQVLRHLRDPAEL